MLAAKRATGCVILNRAERLTHMMSRNIRILVQEMQRRQGAPMTLGQLESLIKFKPGELDGAIHTLERLGLLVTHPGSRLRPMEVTLTLEGRRRRGDLL